MNELRLAFWLLLTGLLTSCQGSCEAPRSIPTGRTYSLFIARTPVVNDMRHWTDWNADQRAWLQELPTLLSSTGDTWVWSTNERDATFVLRTFDSESCSDYGAETFLPSDPHSVHFNTACLSGRSMLLVAAMHGLGHGVDHMRNLGRIAQAGTRHVCRYPGIRPDCHPALSGEAILNPVLPEERDSQGEPLGPNDPHYRLVDLQLLEGR